MYVTNNEALYNKEAKVERAPLRASLNKLDDALSQMNIIGQEIITSLRGGGPEVAALPTPPIDGTVNIAEQLATKAQAVYEKLSEIQGLLG